VTDPIDTSEAIRAALPWLTVTTPVPAAALQPESVQAPAPAPTVPAVPTTAPAARLGGQRYLEEGGGQRAATLQNVVDAIGPASGIGLGFDSFLGVAMIVNARTGRWRRIDDDDYAEMRELLGRGGFKPVSVEIMFTAVSLVAKRHTFDSAHDYANALVWDGVPRAAELFPRYFDAEDCAYTRAASLYTATALAARTLAAPALEPDGVQADMMVVLLGPQGTGKSRGVASLAATPVAFGEVNLRQTDEQIAYVIRAKQVIEVAELRGIAGRDTESTKAWISRRTEEWREPYKRYTTRYPRRCVIFGTSNDFEILDDATGERRYLPITVGRVDVDALVRDRDQIYAEGVALYRANGVAWHEAERLARAEHSKFKKPDAWAEAIARWLDAPPAPRLGAVPLPPGVRNGDVPFAMLDLLREALQIDTSRVKRPEENRAGKLLRNAGFESVPHRADGTVRRMWRRKNS
jgi:predicted P-loop ATPase